LIDGLGRFSIPIVSSVKPREGMSVMKQNSCVHLVGSVPLADARQVFGTISQLVGPYVERIPDGETGPRSEWIRWQMAVMESTAFLERKTIAVRGLYGESTERSVFAPRKSVAEVDWEFGPLGYAKAAIASFDVFAAMKRAGDILPDTRFQVALPTPLAPINSYVDPAHFFAVETVYHARMLVEVNDILAAIPNDQLSIQWDTAVEFAILEKVLPSPLNGRTADIVSRLIRLGNLVPAGVELGYHFCYGDSGHKHFKEPDNCSLLVEVAKGVLEGVTRQLDWLHFPVPVARDDEAYFESLKLLRLPPETAIYLGLIHMRDGLPGAKRRIEGASKFISRFGISTECGFGRRPVDVVEKLLRLHAEVARSLVF
jgi:hypothetical protein